MSPQLISVTGADGSGKSSLCTALVEHYRAAGVDAGLLNIHGAAAELNISPADLHRYLGKLSPESRLLFFCHALQRAYDSMTQRFIFAPGYWYKYAVMEKYLGLSDEKINSLAQYLPQAHATFYLECTPAVAASRKHTFTPYETMGVATAAGFVKTQTALIKHWDDMKSPEWIVISDGSLNDKVTAVLNSLKRSGLMP